MPDRGRIVLVHNRPSGDRGWNTGASATAGPLRRNRRAAVDDDRLAGDKSSGARGEHQCDAGDVFGLTEPPQGRRRLTGGATLWILVEDAGEFGLDEARGNAVDPHIVRAPFG